jgi:hypothetical protein
MALPEGLNLKLKTRILLLSALLTIATGVLAWWVAREQAVGIVSQWAMRYAEKTGALRQGADDATDHA